MNETHGKDLATIITDATEITRALERAAREAHLLHKKLGKPIIVWRDGQVVCIPPEEIQIEEFSK
jgi:hypothetical protein